MKPSKKLIRDTNTESKVQYQISLIKEFNLWPQL